MDRVKSKVKYSHSAPWMLQCHKTVPREVGCGKKVPKEMECGEKVLRLEVGKGALRRYPGRWSVLRWCSEGKECIEKVSMYGV